jgi:hypothetical protein
MEVQQQILKPHMEYARNSHIIFVKEYRGKREHSRPHDRWVEFGTAL